MIYFEKFTDPGNRQINEDTCGIACNEESYCFVVADGLGGHGGGEIASGLAVETVCTMFAAEGWSDHFFENAFAAAQQVIIDEQNEKLAPSRMKTTLVILVVHNKKAYWAHVGDSRLYYFKKSKIIKRTLDHSVPQMLVFAGDIKESEIRHHPDRNRLMHVMGMQGEDPKYEVEKPVKLSGEQNFILCTDGFWELIEDADMEATLSSSSDPGAWIEKQRRIILENGRDTNMDNYTCIAVKCVTKGLFG